ncbi:RsfA family transcriptional regulator [Alkalihalobacillus trypoxylicola]|uniref:Transcriptional regulator n=1 Tax=Alkalihalobacillus trypoxylicola TaxID=519424 RepID=A0A162FB01_9BACI|nr:RsfA family transcriptional regulator [Alkalihalobacillus trypoxylicola]KYG35188.1 transcriptional regulator [Alkalihalobacillus trypoxylicola]GAF63960.1 hypothetical protein BTS2_0852 [Bacillus sp. TS-2]
MTTIRQDAWSTDEDLILAEVVLRHIREGSTQLAAFEEVGQKLSRTSAACGFRWNSTIRKKYESAIHLAKKQRTKIKAIKAPASEEQEVERPQEKKKNVRVFKSKKEEVEPDANVSVEKEEIIEAELEQDENIWNENEPLTMERVIDFLSEYEHSMKLRPQPDEYEHLKIENQRLRERLAKVEEEKSIMKEDYRSLLSIMDRARKLTL